MAKRKRREKPPVETASYTDPEGNVLTLRTDLSRGSIRKIGSAQKQAATVDDAWQRRTEMLFERLAVRWEIQGLPMDDQAMLLGRYRMANAEERRWVQRAIAEHLAEHIPELTE